MYSKKGIPAPSTISFGTRSVTGLKRVPSPPANITTCKQGLPATLKLPDSLLRRRTSWLSNQGFQTSCSPNELAARRLPSHDRRRCTQGRHLRASLLRARGEQFLLRSSHPSSRD